MTSHWRQNERRQVLQIEDTQTQPVQAVTNSNVCHPILPNVSSANKLHALLGHYNSDDSENESDNDSEFKHFMNEIKASDSTLPAPSTPWQELWDPQSGQPYYWNTTTNDLTWEKPKEMTNSSASKPEPGVAVVIKKSDPAKTGTLAVAPAAPDVLTAKCPSIANLLIPRISSTNQLSSTSAPVKQPDTKLELLSRKEDSKISFRLAVPEKSTKNNESLIPKVNGVLWDAASIIAAIEKEVPPDHKQETFVPLFKRRAPDADKAKLKLGNDFKSYFRPSGQSILDFDSESSSQALPTMPSTYRGLGYEEKEEPAQEPVKTQQQLQFVAGEILKPLAPSTPLTLDERIKRLENRLGEAEFAANFPREKYIAQVEILKEAWKKKKLDSSFLDEWLTSVEVNFNEQTDGPETPDQVVDMVLEETDSENEETPKATSPVATSVANNPQALDSELSSFYSDLASLDAVSQPAQPTTPVAKPDEIIPSRAEQNDEDSAMIDPVNKGSKRTKMSSDMTSLVAKWQRIQQENT